MTTRPVVPPSDLPRPPGPVVLVLQGGGALGAYQVGVYQALHESGMEPDWVIGTSIGAINAALIAGNPIGLRQARLDAFWELVAQRAPVLAPLAWPGLAPLWANAQTVARGIPGFFAPNLAALQGMDIPLGVENAAWYRTTPLHDTLLQLLDTPHIGRLPTRLTVGAVHARTGAMRYFDSRDTVLSVEHIMASGALPPAFPAVRIDGEPYWDGGLYSNTPLEAVFDDSPRRSALVFAVNVWQQSGPEPQTITQVLARQKDIQYASRDESHIARQQQLHRLRHIIRALHKQMPPKLRDDPEVQALADWGCGTTMHVVRLLAPALPGEDASKDIDFSLDGIAARRQAGYADTIGMLQRAPWTAPADPLEAVVVYQDAARS